jgi:hypothetical protein
MDTAGPFLGVKHGGGMALTTQPHLVLRSRMSRSYTSSPPWWYMVLAGQLCLYFTLLCCNIIDVYSVFRHALMPPMVIVYLIQNAEYYGVFILFGSGYYRLSKLSVPNILCHIGILDEINYEYALAYESGPFLL